MAQGETMHEFKDTTMLEEDLCIPSRCRSRSLDLLFFRGDQLLYPRTVIHRLATHHRLGSRANLYGRGRRIISKQQQRHAGGPSSRGRGDRPRYGASEYRRCLRSNERTYRGGEYRNLAHGIGLERMDSWRTELHRAISG